MKDLESRTDGGFMVAALSGALTGAIIGEAGRNGGNQYVHWVGYLFAAACGIYSAGAIIYRCMKSPTQKD